MADKVEKFVSEKRGNISVVLGLVSMYVLAIFLIFKSVAYLAVSFGILFGIAGILLALMQIRKHDTKLAKYGLYLSIGGIASNALIFFAILMIF